MRLHIETFSSGRSTAVLFEGQLLPRRSPRGMFDRCLEGLRTPMGLPLFVQALYDACSDHGLLVIRSGATILVQVAPLNRRFQMVVVLPTEEELHVTASADE
jgi:hypothetical protein